MAPSLQRCWILATIGYASAFVSRYGQGNGQRHALFATDVRPDLDQLAKEWMEQVQEDAKSPDKEDANLVPYGSSMDELAKGWIVANKDTDTFTHTPSMGANAPAIMQATPAPSPVSGPAFPAQPQISPPGSMPQSVDWETLAAAWSSINSDVDAGYRPKSEMQSLSGSEAAVSPSLPSVSSTAARSVNWENLAQEWKAINTDIDQVVGTIKTVNDSSSEKAPNLQSDPPLDSVFDAFESSWSEMRQEISFINHEAEQTFEALKQMENEMNSMIDKLHAREASYERKLRQLQEDSSHKENQLLGQLQTLCSQYDSFKRDAEDRRLAEARTAEEGQSRLASQIAELKQSLEEKIGLAKQESERAQEYMMKYQECDSQLSAVQKSHKKELAKTIERFKPAAERLENLRRVTDTLKTVSQGTREIMGRMREKLLVS